MNTPLTHEHYAALIPAYAIGATDAEDCRGLEEHLAGCALCCAQLQDYQRLDQELLYAVPPVSAPFGLSEDLRRRMAASRARAGHAAPARDRLAVLRHPLTWLGFAVVALLILSNAYWMGRVGRIERETAVLGAILEAPGVALQATAELPTGRGVLYAPGGANKGLLCVYDLPALPADRTYQAWLVRNGQRTSAGTFRVNEDGYGVLLIRADQPLETFDSLGVTAEPAGGSPAPTGPRLMGGEL
jgi:anti-sigma-K factor RskA